MKPAFLVLAPPCTSATSKCVITDKEVRIVTGRETRAAPFTCNRVLTMAADLSTAAVAPLVEALLARRQTGAHNDAAIFCFDDDGAATSELVSSAVGYILGRPSRSARLELVVSALAVDSCTSPSRESRDTVPILRR